MSYIFFTQHAVVKAREAFSNERWEAKEAGLRKSKYVQTEPFRNQHDVQSMIRRTIKSELERITWCRETKSYAKNLPKALTAGLSPSRTAGRAPQESTPGELARVRKNHTGFGP